MKGIEFEACLFEPLRERPDGDAVVIVEMRSRGEYLDTLETVRRDIDQMFAIEALVVKEMRGYAKAVAAHGRIL